MSKDLFVEKVIVTPNWDLIVSGTKFKGSIEGQECEGRILVEDNRFYLCQNICNGSKGSCTLGYECSWVVDKESIPSDIIITSLELDPDFTFVIPEVIYVGHYECKIHKGFIKVGCTRVDNDLVRSIASKLIDRDPNDEPEEPNKEKDLPF